MTRPSVITSVVAWRTDLTLAECSIVIANFFGIGFSPDLALTPEPIETIPKPPAGVPVPPITIGEFRATIDKLRRRKRTRPKRAIERATKKVLVGEVQELLDRLDRVYPERSPAVARGWDRPDDWPDEIHDSAETLTDYASRALRAWPALWLTPDRWTLEEHIRAAGAALWGLRWAIESGATETLKRLEPWLDHIVIKTPYDDSDTTRDLIRALRRDPRTSYDLPSRQPQPIQRLDDYLHTTTPGLIDAARSYLRTLPQAPQTLLLSNLIHTFAEELLTDLNDGQPTLTYEWDPETQVLEALAHWRLIPAPGASEPRLLAFLQRGAAALAGTGRGWLSPDEWRALAQSVGVRLTTMPRTS